MLVIAVVLALLNTYPLTSFRDMVFKSKQSAMLGNAGIISTALGGLGELTGEGVAQVMEVIGPSASYSVAVTNSEGVSLFGDENAGSQPEVASALRGRDVFYSSYSAESGFVSAAAMPVMSYGAVIGSVYLFELDAEQGQTLGEMQSTLRNVSTLVAAVVILMSLAFSFFFSRRINAILTSIVSVREGNLGERVRVKGRDEIAQLANEFSDLSDRLREDEQIRRRFVSDASHELKTPIASIRLLSDSILHTENIDGATVREFVADIGEQADRMTAITAKLLTLARQDEGPGDAKNAVELKRVVELSEKLLRPVAEEDGIRIHTELDDGCFVTAPGDEAYQIVFNLMENAVKYNKPYGEIFVTLKNGREKLTLIVEDTGIGIPENERELIFNRFYRVDKARSRALGGSGLGLSIVAGAIKNLGGDIRVESRDVPGTRFTVTLPAALIRNEK